jgi:DNA (cytosine-5)-methyltransferase 1
VSASWAYYNEIDKKAAAWLRELIKEGLIAPGEVDERSIEDVRPDELKGFKQCHFFAGVGVWSYALRRAGWEDDKQVWTGSCPCQPFSAAGKGDGFADERHLWPAFHWLIQECRPHTIFGEQVASKNGIVWFDLVSTDLENTGYTCGACPAPACGFGAPHRRQRMYWVAYSDDTGLQGSFREWAASAERQSRRHASQCSRTDKALRGGGCLGEKDSFWGDADWLLGTDRRWRPVEPGTSPLANGAAAKMGRLRGYGNAIVAPQAQAFIEAYVECFQ